MKKKIISEEEKKAMIEVAKTAEVFHMLNLLYGEDRDFLLEESLRKEDIEYLMPTAAEFFKILNKKDNNE